MTLKFGIFEQYQATAPETIPLPPNYSEDDGETAVYWLSASGVLVNSHGFNIMIDSLLSILCRSCHRRDRRDINDCATN